MPRNLSINAHFNQLASKHTPEFRFDPGKDKFDNWKSELWPKLEQQLGKMPEPVDLNPQTIAQWEHDGLIKEKVVLDVEEGLSMYAYIYRPKDADKDNPYPAIMSCHGHGPHGKEVSMGNRSQPDMVAQINNMNNDYGLQMAKAGYVVIAIDWRGFGERDDRKKPNHSDIFSRRDPCNVNQIRAQLFGRTMLGLNVFDGKRALDYLCAQPYVDENRIGVIGKSLGGTMTTWMTLCDSRIKAADIICYSDMFADFTVRDMNSCGSQLIPNLYALCDLPDLQGLIAPRPLLVEIGVFDQCFRIESAMECYKEVEKIYSAAGASDKLELDLFEGGHDWGANKSFEFFKKALGSINN